MKLLSSLLSFATLIQGINGRLLEPSSPVVATEQHDHTKEELGLVGGPFKNMRSSEGIDGCEFLDPSYFDFSEEAMAEDHKYWLDLHNTGVMDMTDSEHFVPEYISSLCPNYEDEHGNAVSTVTYLLSATRVGSAECWKDYYGGFYELEYINCPQCACAECTDDDILHIIESMYSDDDCEGSDSFQNITITRVDYNIAEESIVSID
jgi:hypothetical protein